MAISFQKVLAVISFLFILNFSHAALSAKTLSGCSSLDVPKYNVVTVNQGKPATEEFQVDFKGDGHHELVRIYQEATTPFRTLPVLVKIFSGNPSCYHEAFHYDGQGMSSSILYGSTGIHQGGNELSGETSVIPNFFGDNKNVLMFVPVNTAYGSGAIRFLNFILYKDSKFSAIEGPALTELSDFKLIGSKGIGKVILVVNGTPGWDKENPQSPTYGGHFGPHLQQVSKFIWDGTHYHQVILGMTQHRYPLPNSKEPLIDQVIKTEPGFVHP